MYKKNSKKQQGGPTYNEAAYKAFGQQGYQAFQEGWMPTVSGQGSTTFHNRYGLLNSVAIPNDSRKGHVAVVGHDNGTFDIMTQNADGKQFGEYIQRNGSYDDMEKYFKTNGSVIKKRSDAIIKGTDQQADGSLIARKKSGGFIMNKRKC